MLVEKKLSEALKDYDKGKKVIVMTVMCDGSMSCDLLEDLFGNTETHFLVDVPAYKNPEYEALKKENGRLMVSNSLLEKEVQQYRKAEEQGLLLKLPCKVGDTVWRIETFGSLATLLNPPKIVETRFEFFHLKFLGEIVFATREEAIDWLKAISATQKDSVHKQSLLSRKEALHMAIEALEKQIPMKPKHIHEEYEKHQWKKDKNGNIDKWAYSSGYCNGPVCERCGEAVCEHCNPDYDEEHCIVDKDMCPVCGNKVYRYEKKKYCDECGQALDWTEEGE